MGYGGKKNTPIIQIDNKELRDEVNEKLAQNTTDLKERGINAKKISNGNSDISDALIQSFLTATQENIKLVKLPKGTYDITKTVSIPKGVDFDASGSVFLVPTGVNFEPLVIPEGDDQKISNFTIKEVAHNFGGVNHLITLRGNSKKVAFENVNTIGGSGFGIASEAGNKMIEITLFRCNATYSKGFGFKFDHTKGIEVIDCHAHYNWLDGFKTRMYALDINLTDCSATHNGQIFVVTGSENGNGIDCYGGGQGVNLTNFVAENNKGGGIYMKHGSVGSELGLVKDIMIVNPRLRYNTGNGLDINRSGGDSDTTVPLVNHVNVVGGLYEENSASGIYIRGKAVSLTSPVVKSNGTHGIDITNGIDVNIVNPIVVANGRSSAGAYNGLNANKVKGLRVFGGLYNGANSDTMGTDDYTGLTNVTNYGILVGSNSDDVIITQPNIKNTAHSLKLRVNMTSGSCLVHYGNWHKADAYGGMGSTMVLNGIMYIRVTGNPSEVLASHWEAVSKKATTQTDSTATDVATLKTDFNALLAKLKTAKLMA